MRPTLAAAILLLAAACRTAAPDVPPTAAAPGDAAAAFAQLEQRMLEGDVDLTVHGLTTGTLDSNIDATVAIAPPRLQLDVKGVIGGRSASYFWMDREHRDPQTVKRAVVIAWLRMGIMHNLVRLLSNQDIDHVEGGIEDVVKVTAVRYDPATRTYAFHILIEGHDLSEATLQLDAAGRPIHRLQTVHFPNGDMHVEEQYNWK